MYNYFSFIPWWGTAICIAISIFVLFLPPVKNERFRFWAVVLLLSIFWLCFYAFRTHVHCFGGDGAVGTIPENLSISIKSFIPQLPGKGRLDTYGLDIITKLGLRTGLLYHFPGMTAAAAHQLFCFVFGAALLILAAIAMRNSPGAMAIALTMPPIFNYFGNVDSYPLPLLVAFSFLIVTKKMLDADRPRLPAVIGYGCFWLFCGWVHPLAGVVGFLPTLAAARWFNTLKIKPKIGDAVACAIFGIVFLLAIKIGYGKTIFYDSINTVPPVFSRATLIHTLNVCILPMVPLVFFALTGPAPREAKITCLHILIWQLICFTFTHFTQGVNDQFPYMLYLVGIAIPWLAVAWKYPLSNIGTRTVLAINLLLLIPMVWVHSTDLTVKRAQVLYPLDDCKHNKEMSWQTHLGLILGDCLEDIPAVKRAVLSTFANGSRNAKPECFRGGNHIYWIAFHYHYGDFETGKRLLQDLIAHNPNAVRYFLSTRPGFIYCNRQRLYDDLYELFPKATEKAQLNGILIDIRNQAAKERYYTIAPAFATCPY